MNPLKKVILTGFTVLSVGTLGLKAQALHTNTSKDLTTTLTENKHKDPLTFQIGVKAIPAVRYNPKINEIGVGGLLELLSIGNSKFRVGAGVFPNLKVSGPDSGKTKNGPTIQATYQPNKKTLFVGGASKEGKNWSPFVGGKFMIGGKGRRK